MDKQQLLRDYKKQEDKMCLAQIIDKIEMSKTRGKIECTDFLDMYQVSLAESFLNGRRGGTVYHRRRGTKKVPENLKKFFPGKNCACLVVYHRILVLKRVFGGFQARKAVLTQGSVGRGSVKKGGMAKNLHGF